MTVEMKPVDSSNVQAIGYDAASRTLHVHFKGGGQYTYADVPQSEFDAFDKSPSKGSYHAANIKGRFQHTKVK